MGYMSMKTNRINVRLTDAIKRKLVLDAHLQDVKISQVVRIILAHYYANRRTT
jgi:hypothetical protein